MTHSMSYFAATGRFLNWLVSSKMDIQKQVLSGGKWNGTQLVAESRGCLGRRFVKEVEVNGGSANLTFSIAGDEDDIDGDGNISNTIIGMFAASRKGFNNEACLKAVQALQNPKGVGTVTQPLTQCLANPPKKSPEGDMVTSFNLSMQDCWYMAKFGIDEWRKVFSASAIRNQCEKIYEGGLGGYYEPTVPWDLPDDITGLVCKGDYDTSDDVGTNVADYVGRCYIPEGKVKQETASIDEAENQFAASGQDAEHEPDDDTITWGITLASAVAVEEKSPSGSTANLEIPPPTEISPERTSLIESLKEFINSGGRSSLARDNVLQAVHRFSLLSECWGYLYLSDRWLGLCIWLL
jgi:hypothetical protein